MLVVTPYYNKPTQEGMFLHFTAIADAVEHSASFIYNIPARSVVDMSVETMARLAKHRNIVGVKDATANLTPPAAHVRRRMRARSSANCRARTIPPLAVHGLGRPWLHQRDGQYRARRCAAPCTLHGGRAVCADAMAIQHRLVPVHDAMFCESSPGPVKYAAQPARPWLGALPAAAGARRGSDQGPRPRRHDRGGAAELGRTWQNGRKPA